MEAGCGSDLSSDCCKVRGGIRSRIKKEQEENDEIPYNASKRAMSNVKRLSPMREKERRGKTFCLAGNHVRCHRKKEVLGERETGGTQKRLFESTNSVPVP